MPTTHVGGSVRKDQRALPDDHDYIGKGRVAACCAKRRYSLRPDADEMNELINHAASIYWLYLEVRGAPPPKAWVAARDQSAKYYFRKMRGTRVFHLQDPILGLDTDLTYMDRLSAAAQEATDLERLTWLGKEELVATLVEGRKAAGVSLRGISYARNLGTIDNEATIIRLAAQGHTNEGMATILDTTEGTIRNRRQRIRRWLTALAERMGVGDRVEAWDRSGGNHHRAAVIQNTYPGGRKPEVALAG